MSRRSSAVLSSGLVSFVLVSFVAARAVAGRPDLWVTTARQARALAPDGWWRRRPFLPVPDASWLAFRMETQYGGDGSGPAGGAAADDVVTFLEWCRDGAAARRSSARADLLRAKRWNAVRGTPG